MSDNSRKKILALVLSVFFVQGLFAQANVDSPYSMFGIGQIRNKTMNARLEGMGGIANAMHGKGLINAENPASYAMIDTLAFLFDAGMYFKTSDFSTSSMSETSNNANFDYVAIAFGATDWWRISLGVQPYSNVGYNLIVNDNKEGIGNYATTFKGSGGLNQAFIGNAFRLGKNLSVGANATYVFGDYETLTTLSFPDSSYMISSRRGIDMMVKSFMFDYGLLYNANIGKDLNLSIGLTYNQKIDLKGAQTTYIRSVEVDSDSDTEYLIDTISYNVNKDARLSMPQGFGFGIALQKNNRWAVGADFNWSQWSKFAREGVNDSLQNSWNVAVGAEFSPKSTSVSNYFRKASYRFGGFYEQTYLSLKGQSINKIGVTAGISLPLPRSLSKVNIGLEVGQCGTKAQGLIQERYFKASVGISVFERWFLKRKYN
ncbi:MAG: hypothetical protein MJZ91_03915 [Bacteroidales bacterium]|nr:hypothetical protein [Bacteroidales bacterium]